MVIHNDLWALSVFIDQQFDAFQLIVQKKYTEKMSSDYETWYIYQRCGFM